MNKEEALDAMLKGIKIANRFFLPNEYLHITNGEVYTEEGYLFNKFFESDYLTQCSWYDWDA